MNSATCPTSVTRAFLSFEELLTEVFVRRRPAEVHHDADVVRRVDLGGHYHAAIRLGHHRGELRAGTRLALQELRGVSLVL